MSDFESFSSSLVSEIVGVDHLVATFRVGSAAAWGASTLERRFLPYYPVLLNPRLANQVTKISVSSIADDGFFCEFLALSWIYLEMTPGFFQDPPQIRQLPVVGQYERCSSLVRFFFIGQ